MHSGPQWIDLFHAVVALLVTGGLLAFALAAFSIKRR